MTSIQNRIRNIFAVVGACVAAAVLIAACGKDDDGKGGGSSVNKVEWDPAVTVRPDTNGQVVLLVSGRTGTPWAAEIVSGDWISFDVFPRVVKTKTGTVGTSLHEREQFVYYKANDTREERTAEIAFTFEGEAPVLLRLVQYSTVSSDDIYQTGQASVWPEIPVYRSGDSYQYVTHYAALDGYNARNYTLCFDKSTYTASWVAYPLHGVHIGSGRPDRDPWAYDPKIAAQYQANLGRGGYGAGFDRGHQIPNADRNGNLEMQYQTFYCSNATPQVSSFNQRIWATLEGKVRRDYVCPDTLYVVTGCYFANRNTTTVDKDGQVCPVPTHYFKVLLRTVRGNIRRKGDLLRDYSDADLQTIGFWFENRSGYPNALSTSDTRSVAEIERQTGFTFFPQVSDAVKAQRNPSAWGVQ